MRQLALQPEILSKAIAAACPAPAVRAAIAAVAQGEGLQAAQRSFAAAYAALARHLRASSGRTRQQEGTAAQQVRLVEEVAWREYVRADSGLDRHAHLFRRLSRALAAARARRAAAEAAALSAWALFPAPPPARPSELESRAGTPGGALAGPEPDEWEPLEPEAAAPGAGIPVDVPPGALPCPFAEHATAYAAAAATATAAGSEPAAAARWALLAEASGARAAHRAAWRSQRRLRAALDASIARFTRAAEARKPLLSASDWLLGRPVPAAGPPPAELAARLSGLVACTAALRLAARACAAELARTRLLCSLLAGATPAAAAAAAELARSARAAAVALERLPGAL